MRASLISCAVKRIAKAKALVDAANAGGGRDNISVLLVKAKDGQGKRGFMSRLLGK